MTITANAFAEVRFTEIGEEYILKSEEALYKFREEFRNGDIEAGCQELEKLQVYQAMAYAHGATTKESMEGIMNIVLPFKLKHCDGVKAAPLQ